MGKDAAKKIPQAQKTKVTTASRKVPPGGWNPVQISEARLERGAEGVTRSCAVPARNSDQFSHSPRLWRAGLRLFRPSGCRQPRAPAADTVVRRNRKRSLWVGWSSCLLLLLLHHLLPLFEHTLHVRDQFLRAFALVHPRVASGRG